MNLVASWTYMDEQQLWNRAAQAGEQGKLTSVSAINLKKITGENRPQEMVSNIQRWQNQNIPFSGTCKGRGRGNAREERQWVGVSSA